MRSFLLATLLGSLVTPAAAQYLVRDIRLPTSGSGSSSVRDIVDFGGIAIFAATQDHGVELWRSDGTPSGTYMLKDINPGSASSNPTNLVVAGNYVFFQATLPGIGNELWRTDGTAAGTILLRDFAAGDASSSLTGLTAYQGKLDLPPVWWTAGLCRRCGVEVVLELGRAHVA
jgi:ELWxxDGT repeat protein